MMVKLKIANHNRFLLIRCCSLILTFVSHNFVCLQEEGSMLQVHGLTLKFVLHYINQSQLITEIDPIVHYTLQ